MPEKVPDLPASEKVTERITVKWPAITVPVKEVPVKITAPTTPTEVVKEPVKVVERVTMKWPAVIEPIKTAKSTE